MNYLLTSLLAPCFFLFCSIVLTICSTAFLRLGKFKSKEFLRSPQGPFFFFFPILKKFFPKQEWENLYFSISLTKHIVYLAYAISAFFYLITVFPHLHQVFLEGGRSDDFQYLAVIGLAIITLSLFIDYICRLLANMWAKQILRFASPFASLILLLLFPIVGLLLRLTRGLLRKVQMEEEVAEQLTDRSKLREMISESELQQHLDPSDQKLITSLVNFKERVAKEIMVPRVDLFALPAETTIREASKLFASEGYSRIPIYKESLDQIVGFVLYKDLLRYYTQNTNLESSLETLAKPVLYSPENKKITLLLQEFRNQQIHMAIIVDEYGGTEGIVTIEDILEELVGEIEDEYDIGEEREFWEIPGGGGWVVDAKMTLFDIENQLGIRIPPNPEYETIGGYIFHCAGTIPSKSWRLSHDDFDLEILSSNERSIKKIKITPRAQG
ncbi:MAG TPA: hemolysin family protein [Chlamydiales bacterium]|jgi:CBS domain containing-hemolysin-like protein|nr:hemolysin family protein [Chlamydiales bacterium]